MGWLGKLLGGAEGPGTSADTQAHGQAHDASEPATAFEIDAESAVGLPESAAA